MTPPARRAIAAGVALGMLVAGPAGAARGPTPLGLREAATGRTDATPAIQHALDALPPAGGTVTLPPGVYELASASADDGQFPDGGPIPTALIVRRDHTRIEGTPGRSILRLAPGAKMRVVTIDASDVTLVGVSVDGDRAGRDPGRGWPGGDVVDALVYVSGATNVDIDHCAIHDGLEDAIGALSSTGVTVQRGTMDDNGSPTAGAIGVAFTGTSGRIAGNTIQRNSAAGIAIDERSTGVDVVDNRVEANAKEGVLVEGSKVELARNRITGNGSDGFAGLSLRGAAASTVQDNRITGNPAVGVAVGDGPSRPSTGITLRRNVITSNGRGAADQVHVSADQRALNADWRSANRIRFGPHRSPAEIALALLGLAGLIALAVALRLRPRRARHARQANR